MKVIHEEQDWALMPQLPNDFTLTTYDEATTVYADKSGSKDCLYAVDIKRDWGVGISPFPVFTLILTLTKPSQFHMAAT